MTDIQEKVAMVIHRAERAWRNAEGEARRYSQERFQALAVLAEVAKILRERCPWSWRCLQFADELDPPKAPLTVPSAATLRATKAVMYFKSAKAGEKEKET